MLNDTKVSIKAGILAFLGSLASVAPEVWPGAAIRQCVHAPAQAVPHPPRAPPSWSLLEPIQEAISPASQPSRKRTRSGRGAGRAAAAIEPDWTLVGGGLLALPPALAMLDAQVR